MKTFTLVSILFLSLVGFSQKITEDKVDEFTKNHIKRTDYQIITSVQYFGAQYRLSKVDAQYFFELLIVFSPTGYFSIQKGDKLMFKSNTGAVVEIEAIDSKKSCLGCGATGLIGSKAQGLKMFYYLSDEQMKFLTENTIDKLRIYTSVGYRDVDLKDKKYLKLKKSIELIN